LENVKQTHSAGIVVIYNKKILLVHPTKEKSFIKTYSFPKGKIESKESIEQAAIRETYEETTFKINPKKLKNVPTGTLTHYFEQYNVQKTYTYFVYQLTDEEFRDNFKGNYEIPSKKLYLQEINHVSFFTLEEAKEKLADRFSEILKFIS